MPKYIETDAEGKPIPVTDGIIDTLEPTFANELLVSFEEITEPSAEALKN